MEKIVEPLTQENSIIIVTVVCKIKHDDWVEKKFENKRTYDHPISSLSPHDESVICPLCGQNIVITIDNKGRYKIEDKNVEGHFEHNSPLSNAIKKAQILETHINKIIALFCFQGQAYDGFKPKVEADLFPGDERTSVNWAVAQLDIPIDNNYEHVYDAICPSCKKRIKFRIADRLTIYNPGIAYVWFSTNTKDFDAHKVGSWPPSKEAINPLFKDGIKIPEWKQPEFIGRSSGCFVATAAYGSSLEPEVVHLREFRDIFLLRCQIGRSFVSLYERTSPPLATFISVRPWLRILTRYAIWPLLFVSKMIMREKIGR